MTVMAAKILAFIVLGAAGGALLGSTRSCEDGGCPLTATPKRGAMWGSFLGLMMGVAITGPAGVTRAYPVNEDLGDSPIQVVVTREDFEAAVGGDGLTVAYFYADWCGACNVFKPTLYEVAREYGGNVRFVGVNTTALLPVAEEHGVQYLPTTILFRGGKEIGRLTGAASKETLVAAIT